MMKIEFWGVRGAATATDADKLSFGGNTNSIVITLDQMPNHLFLLDAGTGLAQFGRTMSLEKAYNATLLLSNLHLYHMIGFQFSPLAFSPHCSTRVIGPNTHNIALESIFDHIMSPSYSPVYGLSNLLAKIAFEEVSTKQITVGDVTIDAKPFENKHAPMDSWGYRIETPNGSLAYITDAHRIPQTPDLNDNATALIKDVDVLIFGTFDPQHEYSQFHTYDEVLQYARKGKVGQVIFCHHHPLSTDATLERFQKKLREQNPDLNIILAYEGLVIEREM